MKLLTAFRTPVLLALLLAGCAAPPPTPKAPPAPEISVTPVPLHPLTLRVSGQGLTDTLVTHYLQGPYYRLSLPLLLDQQYRQVDSQQPEPRRFLAIYRSQRDWGSVSVTAGRGSIMNAFRVQGGGRDGYALVLKQVRICLNADADNAPYWQSGRWVFSPSRPGRFECSGRTRGSLFQKGSGLPGLLGPYAEDGDTVLFDTDWTRLQQIAARLSARFPHLRVPHIQ
ncbi:hypothetical protein H9C73_11000 [Marinobacterium sp. AK62]|uniref:Lipoprotein n=1 Tax=Marinobacterium alkalitolerans TaxID=1542925 RepID=A0ABS3ZC31_9GAMM|nr:hypothetical protein [Marinobacterium alkalitolerans]MBP0049264.1 hypothetical protein [Marinobacterium alkalitolerans]